MYIYIKALAFYKFQNFECIKMKIYLPFIGWQKYTEHRIKHDLSPTSLLAQQLNYPFCWHLVLRLNEVQLNEANTLEKQANSLNIFFNGWFLYCIFLYFEMVMHEEQNLTGFTSKSAACVFKRHTKSERTWGPSVFTKISAERLLMFEVTSKMKQSYEHLTRKHKQDPYDLQCISRKAHDRLT